MSGSIELIRAWVIETLGSLADDDDQHAMLRDTLRVFLQEGGSFKATAERLTLHKNTVQYRVRKAEESLGRPVGEDRLQRRAGPARQPVARRGGAAARPAPPARDGTRRQSALPAAQRPARHRDDDRGERGPIGRSLRPWIIVRWVISRGTGRSPPSWTMSPRAGSRPRTGNSPSCRRRPPATPA